MTYGTTEEFALEDGKRNSTLRAVLMTDDAKASLVVRKPVLGRRLLPTEISLERLLHCYQFQSGRLAGCMRYFFLLSGPSSVCFDAKGRLVDYDEEAADTWLRYMGNGYPQPVEAAWLELDEMGRSLGPKKMRD